MPSPSAAIVRLSGCTTSSSAVSCIASRRTRSSNASCLPLPWAPTTSRNCSSMRACWVSSRSTTSMSGPSGSTLSAVLGSGTAGTLLGAQRFDRVRAVGLQPVLVAEPLPVDVDDDLARRLLASMDLFLHLLEAFVCLPHVPGAELGEVDLGREQVAQ